jgi:hypothetical protein
LEAKNDVEIAKKLQVGGGLGAAYLHKQVVLYGRQAIAGRQLVVGGSRPPYNHKSPQTRRPMVTGWVTAPNQWPSVGRPISGDQRVAIAGRSAGGGGNQRLLPSPAQVPHFPQVASPFFSPILLLLGTLVNSTSLAPAHARPTQTSPKNFKHP